MFVCLIINLCRCVCDKFFRLCEECDKVFHKSAAKRSHIRVPVLNVPLASQDINADLKGYDAKVTSLRKNGLSSTTSFSLLWESMNESCTNALKSCGSTPGVVLVMNYFDFETKDFLTFKESVLCVLLAGIRGLLDDRKVMN